MARIHPHSFAFTLLLGLLSSLPTFGIDMIFPTLSATGAALRAPAAEVGWARRACLVGAAASFIVYGRVWDRFGRIAVIVVGCGLLIVASIGCIFARSLPQPLVFR